MSQPAQQPPSTPAGDAAGDNNNANAPTSTATATNPTSTTNPPQTPTQDTPQDTTGDASNDADANAPLDTAAGNIQPHAIHHGPIPEANSGIRSRVIDIMGLPQGYTIDHSMHTITGQKAVRGYGLQGTQPHYVIHNVPKSLETDFIEFLDKRADYFEWDDTFPEGTTDVTMHNDGQQTMVIQFYRLDHDYVNADAALLHLICTFLCWEAHYTGHAHSKKSNPRKWCYKHRIVYEVTYGLGYILLINGVLHLPHNRAIRAALPRGHPAYAAAQEEWRRLRTPIALAEHHARQMQAAIPLRRTPPKTKKPKSRPQCNLHN